MLFLCGLFVLCVGVSLCIVLVLVFMDCDFRLITCCVGRFVFCYSVCFVMLYGWLGYVRFCFVVDTLLYFGLVLSFIWCFVYSYV